LQVSSRKIRAIRLIGEISGQKENMMEKKQSQLVYSTDPELQKRIQEEHSSDSKTDAVNLPPEQQQIKISLQTKGLRGKQVTLIQGFQHDPGTLHELARKLKQFCGAGGTVKGQEIEIQGDKRKMVAEKLGQFGYRTKVI